MKIHISIKGGREGGREGGRKGGREGGREGGRVQSSNSKNDYFKVSILTS